MSRPRAGAWKSRAADAPKGTTPAMRGNLGVSATLVVRAPSLVSGGLPRTGAATAPLLFAGLGLLGLGALVLGAGRRGRNAASTINSLRSSRSDQ
ncbi:MAG TPA: LPXTG cell wall anchor domain-containing protein [Actinomycetes bacterium]|nr:LPXTG cell wall anchor domain-containing protein [Actinomycetes bacterium]